MSTRAIISGDIVGSTLIGAEATDAAMACLGEAAQDIGEWIGEDTRFTRFRGDGWQIYLHLPILSLHAVLFLFARLRASGTGTETRMAIGFGKVDRIGTSDLSDAAGEAFALAGEALDEMPRHRRIALGNWTILHEWHHGVFELAAWIASRWTPEQAEAVSLAIHPDRQHTQAEIAERLKITRQAVQSRLSGAGWDALGTALDAVLHHDWGAHTHA